MAKHRQDEGDPPSILPATVEQLAAQQRARPRPRLSLKRHAIVAAAAAGLLLTGATGWALTRPGGPSEDGSQALGPDALASAAAVEGFGPASPLVSHSGAPRPSTSTSRASPSPAATATALTPVITAVSGMDAAYTMVIWQGGFQVNFNVTNPTSTPALWKIRVRLPANARYDHSWSAEVTQEGDVLTFTPPRWDSGNPKPLAPGTAHSFGFIALQQAGGEYRLLSCTVDGQPCRASTP